MKRCKGGWASRCVQCWTTEARGGGAVRVDETSKVELSERWLRQPAATRLTLDCLAGRVTWENTNLSIHKGTIIHHPKQL